MIKELEILNEISNLKGDGSNKGKQILLANNSTDIMKYLLDVAFNPFKTTKLNKIQELTEAIPVLDELESYESYFKRFTFLIEELLNAKAANNDLRYKVSCLIATLPSPKQELKDILIKVITKSLNIGVGISSINKAFGYDFLPDLSVMLAEDDPSELPNWREIHAELKYDGVRVLAIYDKERKYFKFITRAFNELNCLCFQNITKSLLEIAEKHDIPNNWFFDGELTDSNRKSVSGKVTKILRDTAPLDIDKDFIFNIFDFEDFTLIQESKDGIVPYLKRRSFITEYLNSVESTYLKLSESWILKNVDEVSDLFKQVVINGHEGLICKNPDHVYTPDRNKNWTKMKEVNEADLKITGWYPGDGKRAEKGYIGGFNMQTEDGLLTVKIGGGFDDELLQEISKDPDSYIGKIASVQYNVKIQDKINNWSLFLPRLVEIRHDKLIANNLTSLK